mmetsp:Transcript_102471/g.290194  ORF Transcript_102471/g.290194 Transcript_102471/m.290194 type:complete len:247 (-) Transcript_102471:23-763(-)
MLRQSGADPARVVARTGWWKIRRRLAAQDARAPQLRGARGLVLRACPPRLLAHLPGARREVGRAALDPPRVVPGAGRRGVDPLAAYHPGRGQLGGPGELKPLPAPARQLAELPGGRLEGRRRRRRAGGEGRRRVPLRLRGAADPRGRALVVAHPLLLRALRRRAGPRVPHLRRDAPGLQEPRHRRPLLGAHGRRREAAVAVVEVAEEEPVAARAIRAVAFVGDGPKTMRHGGSSAVALRQGRASIS